MAEQAAEHPLHLTGRITARLQRFFARLGVVLSVGLLPATARQLSYGLGYNLGSNHGRNGPI
jgi:hypothetical protein